MTATRAAPVVALVFSAGGLDAAGRILGRLPPTFPGAVVVLRHQDPRSADQLAQVLRRRTALPVDPARDGDPLTPGQVLVAPAGYHTLVRPDRTIALIVSGARPPYRPSADLLLTSIALAAGPDAVAVILSGYGNDGATGATAIHHFGGTVIASDAASSSVFAMPEAAITRDEVVDRIADVQDIPGLLVDLLSGRTDRAVVADRLPGG